jgi:glycosyltransferase involved in cell wall biosynthesis
LKVDFLIGTTKGPYISNLPSSVRVLELGNTNPDGIVGALVCYLKENRPEVLLCTKRGDREALLARDLAGVSTRIALRTGTTVTQRDKSKSFFKKWQTRRKMREAYSKADIVVAVSNGVAEDLTFITRLPPDKISVIPNPVVTPELVDLSRAPLDHPWFRQDSPPVILGAGGLRRAKDFPTLIEAFAKVRRHRPSRLMILGEGRQRDRLEKLAEKLGVREDFMLPGFVENPYAFMARAGLFVLSSLWEGSPNVLTEALAVGTPVVSTDCRSGPKEILQNGRFGPLVPVGKVDAMAKAMLETLRNPLDSRTLRSATSAYTLEKSAEQYISILGLREDTDNTDDNANETLSD